MHRYYYIDTNGDEKTNLQLYSLKQAKLYWAALEADLSHNTLTTDIHERCAFIICTIGLSISQLLGQNHPSPEEGRVTRPKAIFDLLVTKHSLDIALKEKFKDFIDAYDHCRHFGLTSDNSRHVQVSQITVDKTRELYEFGLHVWQIVIDIYKHDKGCHLEGFHLEEIEKPFDERTPSAC